MDDVEVADATAPASQKGPQSRMDWKAGDPHE